jgi:hypothetical protein
MLLSTTDHDRGRRMKLSDILNGGPVNEGPPKAEKPAPYKPGTSYHKLKEMDANPGSAAANAGRNLAKPGDPELVEFNDLIVTENFVNNVRKAAADALVEEEASGNEKEAAKCRAILAACDEFVRVAMPVPREVIVSATLLGLMRGGE